LGEGLTLIRVALNGVALTDSQYKLTDESLTIVDVPQNTTFTLVIENTINPKANSALEGWHGRIYPYHALRQKFAR
jgi:aminopeptidase N